MKTKLIALALFAATAATVALYPAAPPARPTAGGPGDPAALGLPALDPAANERPRVEVVFVLDTTGSMGGLIDAAKDKIWSIASTLASARPVPEIRMGLVAYRDRGDDYVTRVVDLSPDLDAIHAALMDFEAQGGGDGPESVNQALHEAVHRIAWGADPGAYRVVFLVGDAPPHLDYPNDVPYPETLAAARQRGITVNAIQCGQEAATTGHWQRVAQAGGGTYLRVEQGGGAVAIASPYDARLAELAARLDETRLYYGSAEEQAAKARKLAASEKLEAEATLASRARRAAFNAADAGKTSFLGDKELVEEVSSGRVALEAIPPAALPAPLQAMEPEARQALIAEKADARRALTDEIQALSAERERYLGKKIAEQGGAGDSLDHQLYGAIREQAEALGLSYERETPVY
jgi:Mg-chelatase subunit ChlD